MAENKDQQQATEEKSKVEWTYEGNSGPANWGELTPEFASCSIGKNQSPIDISGYKATPFQGLEFNYKTAKGSFINNGHTIQVNITNEENTVNIDGINYKLIQFHFHTPSEHTLKSESFPMELHLVHSDADGNLAVIGVMLKNGAHNQTLSQVWDLIPSQKEGQEVELEELIDIAALLPSNSPIFRYSGSLTTPPCTEGVTWLVMETPIEMSVEQIKIFKSAYPTNNRPIQELNGREITKYA